MENTKETLETLTGIMTSMEKEICANKVLLLVYTVISRLHLNR